MNAAEEDYAGERRTVRREVRDMARSQEGERPVNDDEFESMPWRIRQHFDRVRDLLTETLDQRSSGE